MADPFETQNIVDWSFFYVVIALSLASFKIINFKIYLPLGLSRLKITEKRVSNCLILTLLFPVFCEYQNNTQNSASKSLSNRYILL